jgi:hypothetical protein
MQCILYKIYFWKFFFHMYYNLICIFICTPICTKFYSCKKWVLQIERGRTLGAVRVRNELARTTDPGQRRQFGWAPLGRPVACKATRERSNGRLGWAGCEVSAQCHFLGLNPFLFSKLFSNLQITLNSTQI